MWLSFELTGLDEIPDGGYLQLDTPSLGEYEVWVNAEQGWQLLSERSPSAGMGNLINSRPAVELPDQVDRGFH